MFEAKPLARTLCLDEMIADDQHVLDRTRDCIEGELYV